MVFGSPIKVITLALLIQLIFNSLGPNLQILNITMQFTSFFANCDIDLFHFFFVFVLG